MSRCPIVLVSHCFGVPLSWCHIVPVFWCPSVPVSRLRYLIYPDFQAYILWRCRWRYATRSTSDFSRVYRFSVYSARYATWSTPIFRHIFSDAVSDVTLLDLPVIFWGYIDFRFIATLRYLVCLDFQAYLLGHCWCFYVTWSTAVFLRVYGFFFGNCYT